MDEADKMLQKIREEYHLNSPRVFSAMKVVPREEFIPLMYRQRAYEDSAFPIGFDQTISQPYTVALMTHLICKGRTLAKSVLEIGTGSGYQAAVLSKLFKKVYTVEIIPELAQRAGSILTHGGYKNIKVITGSGEGGYKRAAPFDAIIITAAVKKVPQNLFNQLKTQGVLVAPVGKGESAVMKQYIKTKNKLKVKNHGTFSFVPFVKDGN